jgi:hypothetical protein
MDSSCFMGSFEQFAGLLSSSEAGGDFGRKNCCDKAPDPRQAITINPDHILNQGVH